MVEKQDGVPGGDAPKENKKHTKRKARHTDRDVINQLRTGDLNPEELARALNLDASRIGATIDRPTSSGVAVIKELLKMPRETLTGEIIPALEKELIISLEAEYEEKTSVSGRLLNLINALGALGEDAYPSLQKAYGYDHTIDLFLTRKLGPNTPRTRVESLLRIPCRMSSGFRTT